MENKEKNEKILCVLRNNMDSLEFNYDGVRYKKDNLDIRFGPSNEYIAEVSEPGNFLGFKIGKKVITKGYLKPVGRFHGWIHGIHYSDNVELPLYTEFIKEFTEYRERKFEKELLKECKNKRDAK